MVSPTEEELSSPLPQLRGGVAALRRPPDDVALCEVPAQDSHVLRMRASDAAARQCHRGRLVRGVSAGRALAPIDTDGAAAVRREAVRAGQIRSFRIVALDPGNKQIELELAG